MSIIIIIDNLLLFNFVIKNTISQIAKIKNYYLTFIDFDLLIIIIIISHIVIVISRYLSI